MSERARLLEALAVQISDYRLDEIQPRTPDLIDAWIQQFPPAQQVSLLGALLHVFGKTYIFRSMFDAFLKELASTDIPSHAEMKQLAKSVATITHQSI